MVFVVKNLLHAFSDTLRGAHFFLEFTFHRFLVKDFATLGFARCLALPMERPLAGELLKSRRHRSRVPDVIAAVLNGTRIGAFITRELTTQPHRRQRLP